MQFSAILLKKRLPFVVGSFAAEDDSLYIPLHLLDQ